MIGFILAAGFGTRLEPLTEHVPKALIPVCGIPILQRSLDLFLTQGIHKLGVNAHHLPEQIYAFRDNSSVSFDIFHEEGKIRGTGGAFYFARDFLSSDEIFCVANVDIISNADIQKLAELFLASESMCALVAAPANGNGTILYNPTSKEYCGIPAEVTQNSDTVGADYIGIAFYQRKVLDLMTCDDFSILPVWKRIQEQDYSVKVLVEDDIFWRDTGTPLALAQIHFDVLDKTVHFKIPENIFIDYEKKIAYPKMLPPEAVSTLKEYSWTDSDSIAPTASITKSIVFEGVVVPDNESVSDTILTQWGGIPFEL